MTTNVKPDRDAISKRMAELSPEKRAVLERLLREKRANGARPHAIPRRAASDSLPLSFAQQRLWFLDQLVPGNAFYNVAAAVHLTTALDDAVLERSLNEIVRRQETLRTTFDTIDGRPIQVIAPTRQHTLSVVDLSSLPEAEREAEATRLSTEEARRPFDLSRGPLIRTTLLRLGAQDHIFLATTHHVISDGWSVGIFFRELSAIYGAFIGGRPSPLPELPVQYADYSVWQREWLQGEVLEQQLSYWKRQLRELPVLELPADRPRPAVQTFHGAHHHLTLPAELTAALKALSQREGVTLFMTLLAAFKALLHRYTGMDDIVVGSPIAGRHRAELESLIGFFVNTLVLRGDLSGDPTFVELLRRVRDVALGAYAHQDLPFEKLVEELRPQRDLSRNPLCQVAFQLQSSTNGPRPSDDAASRPLTVESGTAKFDLYVELWELPEGIGGQIEYNTDLFDAATIARMSGHLRALLEDVAAHPERRLSALSLLTTDERRQLLREWNDTRAPFPDDTCIHQLFEEQAARTPEAAALVFGGRRVSYGELNRRANRLARDLRGCGVRAETLVGVMVERSVEMVVSLLGVLKAGGAYVPLDPAYPSERLSYMIEDAGVKVLLTQEGIGEQGAGDYGAEVVYVERGEEIEREDAAGVESGVRAENLAYVIYTSGSTGRPKGVQVSHRGLCNVAEAQRRTLGVGPHSRVLQFSSLSFDASIFEIVMALCSGGTLCLGAREALMPGAPLLNFLTTHGVTTVTLPPSALATLPAAPLPELQTITVAGEACPAELVERWATGRRFFNLYGPTEATIWVSVEECAAGDGAPTIGRPVANTAAYILDRHLRPVPVGVPGELHLSGVGLARGYLDRPDLTAEKFIPDPFGGEPGARLYKSGDLARYLPDGSIAFLGRLDHQVKLRGFRIEPGEIEAVMSQYPGVREALVLTREDTPGDKRLVAYVVRHAQQELSVSRLRQFLQGRLPQHMIPAAFVVLPELPQTPNGKVDRRALPAPDNARPELEQVYVAAETEAEKILTEVWAQVLGVEQVGVNDNFFELGGDSILSIQVIARANQAGLRLAPEQLFRHQTIGELATVTGIAPVVRAEQGLVEGDAPLTPIQQWFFEQELVDPHHFNQSALLEVGPELNQSVLESVFRSLLIQHDALRLRFVREAAGWRQFHAGPVEAVPCARIDVSGLTEPEQREAIERHASELQAGLDLSRGPLVRAAIFDRGAHASARLLIVIHHLVVDGVSWRILLDDMRTAFDQLSRGEAIELPPKTTSFKHWAERLEEHAHSRALQREAGYWLSAPDAPDAPPPRLPVDFEEGENTVASSRTLSASLGVAQTRALLKDVPKAYNTQVNDVLLAALGQAFARWTGGPSLLLDLEGHGREALFEDVDLSRTVGWFTSIFPVRLETDVNADMGEQLKSVKERLRRIPQRGVGYGLLRYLSGDAGIAGRLQALPRPEVSFNYLGQFGKAEADASETEGAESDVAESGGVEESGGAVRGPRNRRRHLLEINASVVAGRLQVLWTYSENAHSRATIENLSHSFVEALQALIAHCQKVEAGAYTPSDFPQARVSQKDLDSLMLKLSRAGERGAE